MDFSGFLIKNRIFRSRSLVQIAMKKPLIIQGAIVASSVAMLNIFLGTQRGLLVDLVLGMDDFANTLRAWILLVFVVSESRLVLRLSFCLSSLFS